MRTNEVSRTGVRWKVVTLIFLATAINYLDRANLSVAAPVLMKELNIDAAAMGVIMSAFFWSYSLMQIPSGVIVDRLGSKVAYSISIAWWSLASALTSIVNSFATLFGIRALLGIGEAPAFPTNTKVISQWLPKEERGVANGIFSAGITVGSAFTPPIITWLMVTFSWRISFVITGAVGFVWLIFWLVYFRNKPREFPGISEEELKHIESGMEQYVSAEAKIKWYQLLKYRNVWGLILGFFAQDYILYVFITWLPGYLVLARHMTILKMGFYAMIPYIFACFATIFGGWLSDYLIKNKGYSPLMARKMIMTIGMFISVAITPAAFVESATLALVLLTISLGGMMFANGAIWAVATHIAPPGASGTLAGIQNFLGNLGGIAAPIVTGYIFKISGSFVPALLTAGIIALVGACCYLFLIKEPINLKGNKEISLNK